MRLRCDPVAVERVSSDLTAMKLRSVWFWFLPMLFLSVRLTSADSTPSGFPPFAIARSELRDFPPNAAGRAYQLQIGLPASYATSPEKRYPVVFVTDGYWDFPRMFVAQGALVYDKVAPEFIIVGLGYAAANPGYDNFGAMRRWELSPVPSQNPDAGHAAEFVHTLETVLIPFVEREYRVDSSHRVLAGASLGGLFTLYAMYTKPDLFSAYIASTPAVVSGDDWLLQYEEEFARSGRALPVRLFVSGGGNESPRFLGGILRFNARVAARKYAGLEYQFRIIDEERHAGMQSESYSRGLRFVFAPLAPESGAAGGP